MAKSTDVLTPGTSAEAVSLVDACIALERWLDAIEHDMSSGSSASEWETNSRVIESIDPLVWLWSQECVPRCYWDARDRSAAWAAVGAADRIVYDGQDPHEVVRTVSSALQGKPPGAAYIGGLSFDFSCDKQSSQWQPFAQSLFILPALSVTCTHGKHAITAHARRGNTNEELRSLLDYNKRSPAAAPRTIWERERFSFTECPNKDSWESMVSSILQEIRSGTIQKLVLSRLVKVAASFSIDPLHLLLRAREHAPYGASFLLEPKRGCSFVGHSPEMLYRRDRRRIESEAVAGTRKRGASKEEDDFHACELRTSDKDQREHALVAVHVADALHTLCDELTLPGEPVVRRLARVQHLVSPFSGRLRNGVSDADIVRALHPTPAVSGTPVPESIRRINQLEPHDRGWYAGLVGTISHERAEFAVAIRSALVSGKEALLYAGSGIVDGSDPASEWEETGQKLGGLLKAFTDP